MLMWFSFRKEQNTAQVHTFSTQGEKSMNHNRNVQELDQESICSQIRRERDSGDDLHAASNSVWRTQMFMALNTSQVHKTITINIKSII